MGLLISGARWHSFGSGKVDLDFKALRRRSDPSFLSNSSSAVGITVGFGFVIGTENI